MSQKRAVAAVIDIGTNSTRLLVGDIFDGKLVPLLKTSRITRLGRGVDSSKRLSKVAMQETLAVVTEFAALARHQGAAKITVVATSAVRDAANQNEFCDLIETAAKLKLCILSGRQEAVFSYRGALSGFAEPPESPLIADVGGGSTELVTSENTALSIDMGAVRVTERFLCGDPPSPAEIEGARHFIKRELRTHALSLGTPRLIIGLGGTITCLGGITASLDEYDSKIVHMSSISSDALGAFIESLMQKSIAQRGLIRGMQKGREDIILGGALIFQELLGFFALDKVVVCDADIMEGALLSDGGDEICLPTD